MFIANPKRTFGEVRGLNSPAGATMVPAVPLSPLTIRKIPLTRRQSRAGGKFRAFQPVVRLLSAPLARRSHPCRRGGEARLTQARQFLIADVRLRRRRGRHVRPSRQLLYDVMVHGTVSRSAARVASRSSSSASSHRRTLVPRRIGGGSRPSALMRSTVRPVTP